MIRVIFCIGFALLSAFSSDSQADIRTWTDRTGKHEIEAEMIGLTDGIVRLRRSDGRTMMLAIGKLSRNDQSLFADREWIDHTEKKRMRAKLIKFHNGKVTLKTRSGKTFVYPISRLSQKDRALFGKSAKDSSSTAGPGMLSPNPKVEAILRRWNDSKDKDDLTFELTDLGEEGILNLLYYAHLYYLNYERENRKKGYDPPKEEYVPKMRLSFAAHDAIRKLDSEMVTQKRVLSESNNLTERVLIANRLASRYGASTLNMNVPELRKLVSIQKEGLLSKDRYAILFAAMMTDKLGDLAETNRDLIEQVVRTTKDDELKQAATVAISNLVKRVARIEKPKSTRTEARPPKLQPDELESGKEDFDFFVKRGVVFYSFPEPDSDWAYQGMLPDIDNAVKEFDPDRFYSAILYTSALLRPNDLERFESLSGHLIGFTAGRSPLRGAWRFDDAALQKICRNKKLKYLSLTQAAVSDDGLENITALSNLVRLNLRRVPVSDACIEHIASRPLLEYVDIRSTRVTIGAAKTLHEKRPELTILHLGNEQGGFLPK